MTLRKSPASHTKASGIAASTSQASIPACPLENAAASGIRQVIDAEGRLTGDLADPEIPHDQLLRLYETMVLVRAIDDRGWTLQRSGRVEFWIPHRGLEAVHNAATLAFDAKDWIWMGYRHPGVMLLRGVALLQLFTQFFGRVGEPLKGRRLPTMMGDGRVNVVPMTTQVGSYIPHACGAAWGAKLKRHDTRFLAIFGDGASSRGEFHSGMNFAGIHKPPIVFICENNGWAISTPQSLQTASATFAEKGDAYGVRNLRVDGNDPLAVYSVVHEARELAAEQGASLIEAITYRMGFHTSSDNPDLYRKREEVEIWEPWDPLTRMRKYLEGKQLWDDTREEALWARSKSEIAEAVNQAEDLDFPHPATMFDDTFQELTWMLEEQRAQLLADLEDPT
jgi:TPP-dependent pyruvate/acetoin dehydrogenase alpha subunit